MFLSPFALQLPSLDSNKIQMLSTPVWNKDEFYILFELPEEHAYQCKYKMKTLIVHIVLVALVGMDSGLLST